MVGGRHAVVAGDDRRVIERAGVSFHVEQVEHLDLRTEPVGEFVADPGVRLGVSRIAFTVVRRQRISPEHPHLHPAEPWPGVVDENAERPDERRCVRDEWPRIAVVG